jgi:adenylate cyclase
MPDVPTEPTVRGIATRYVFALTGAQILTAAEVAAVLISLSSQAFDETRALLTGINLAILVVLSVLSVIVTVGGALWSIAPSLRWYVAGAEPTDEQRRHAVHLVRRETAVLMSTWLVAGGVLIALNPDAGWGSTALLVFGVLFGASSSVSTSLLFTQRIYRPIIAAANKDFTARVTAPGVIPRLVLMWVMNAALPSLSVATLIVCHAYGWFIPSSASLVIPVVVMTVVSVALGLRALILVSRSISDPIGDVVAGMAEVEHGRLGRTVDVYEQSEIGRLQHGFNSMVAGLIEREHLRDLFGRHVGPDVVALAIEGEQAQAGEERDVAVLFIDLAGSTQLAANRPPHEVAEVLNAFFRIVVAAVDAHGGSINKFQGDAALAVFGAPLRSEHAAAAALATARALSANMRTLPVVDFGIGVSAGPVFAGNIGAENRYEYTVIGDPVNEAARLADTAKAVPGRTVASGAAIDRADTAEQCRWAAHGSEVLRGRSEPTRISVPHGHNGDHD